MRRIIGLLVGLIVAGAASGCGALLDVAYAIDDGKYTNSQVQRRPTGQFETSLDREAVLAEDGRTLRVVCEERVRSVDRVWTVAKTYEMRGGYYQAHWFPIIFETAVAGGVALGVGLKCGQDGEIDCDALYWTVPFGVDVVYSAVRLLMVKKPKLVDKQYGTPHNAQSEPVERRPQPCEPGTTILVGRAVDDPVAVRAPVGGDGSLDPEGQARVLNAIAAGQGVGLYVVGPDGTGTSSPLNRCAYLRAHEAELAAEWSRISQECPAPQPAPSAQPST